jgi:hypothetical protein
VRVLDVGWAGEVAESGHGVLLPTVPRFWFSGDRGSREVRAGGLGSTCQSLDSYFANCSPLNLEPIIRPKTKAFDGPNRLGSPIRFAGLQTSHVIATGA